MSLGAALLLAACAQSSGVMEMGPDTYSISVHAAPARGGTSGAKRIALTNANEFCRSQNKRIFVTNISSGASAHFPGGTVDVTFRCLAEDDSGLRRPSYKAAPDAVIEHRVR
jgi:hypothetical protein